MKRVLLLSWSRRRASSKKFHSFHFSEKRIRLALEKLIKTRLHATQGRLDSFFKVAKVAEAEIAAPKNGTQKRAQTAAGKNKHKVKKS